MVGTPGNSPNVAACYGYSALKEVADKTIFVVIDVFKVRTIQPRVHKTAKYAGNPRR